MHPDNRRNEPAVLAVGDLRLATLLVTGTTRRTIASTLKVSIRSTQNQVTRLRAALGATTAYTYGVLAIRRRVLSADTIIGHARQHINHDWTQPTMREYEILRLLSTGLTDHEAGNRVGISEITVRRTVQRLAVANGAHARITAGALFEALAWN